MRDRQNFSLHTTNLFFYLLFLSALASSVYLMVKIAGYYMEYLSYLLYDKSHLSAVSRLLGNHIMPAFLFAVLFFLAALMMLYLYYFSYYQLIYLKLSILCLLCILYCISLADTDTIFHIGSASSLLWQNAGIISCAFLILFFILIAFDLMLDRFSLLLTIVPYLILATLSVFMFFRRYAKNILLFSCILLGLLLFALFFCILSLLTHGIRSFLWALPSVACCVYMAYANYLYRGKDYTISVLNHRAMLYNITLFAAAINTLYLIIALLIQKRGLLLHSRSLNKELMELEHSKHLLIGMLYSNEKNYLYGARKALDTISSEPVLSKQARESIQELDSELTNIGSLYNQVHDYTIFSGNIQKIYPNHVNMDIFLRTLEERLRYTGILTSKDSVSFHPNLGCSVFVPEYLLSSIENLLLLLRSQTADGSVRLRNAKESGYIILSLSFSSDSSPEKRQHEHFQKLLRPGTAFIPDFTRLDHSVSMIRHLVQSFGGFIRLSMDRGFFLRICLPLSSKEPAAYQEETVPCRDTTRQAVKQLLFITSDSMQRSNVEKMLPFDRYTITIANDAEEFLQHPQRLSAYSLIILGNLYRHVYFRDFYNAVRKNYSMTELPMLLLLPDLYTENSFYIRSTINDYLVPPYSQAALSKKIHALVTAKKTADLALESQLEFWQSQINPHFIFNSINSIMHMCIKEPMKAYELLGDFSEYLRSHLLSQSLNKASTIQKEINLISAYLEIERARFGDKIHYSLDIDCAEDFPILPLLIEPLVENSIKHSPMHESGVSVNVQIFQMEDHLLVSVADNGNGMSGETISQILSDNYERNSIGLSNVCNRLRYYYHTVPTIESKLGEGTTVQFTIKQTDANI